MSSRARIRWTVNGTVTGSVLHDGTSYKIGRGAGCDIRLLSVHVSRLHAVIKSENGNWTLKNYSSSNPVVITRNGQDSIINHLEDPFRLEDGVDIAIGDLHLRFEFLPETSRAPTPNAAAPVICIELEEDTATETGCSAVKKERPAMDCDVIVLSASPPRPRPMPPCPMGSSSQPIVLGPDVPMMAPARRRPSSRVRINSSHTKHAKSDDEKEAMELSFTGVSSIEVAGQPTVSSASTTNSPQIPGIVMNIDENLLQCSICMEVMHHVACVTPCIHRYCYACILEWKQVQNHCPQCRETIGNVVRDYGFNQIIEGYLALNPDKCRPANELSGLDNKEKMLLAQMAVPNRPPTIAGGQMVAHGEGVPMPRRTLMAPRRGVAVHGGGGGLPVPQMARRGRANIPVPGGVHGIMLPHGAPLRLAQPRPTNRQPAHQHTVESDAMYARLLDAQR